MSKPQYTKTITLASGHQGQSQPKSTCRPAKGSRFQAMRVKEMKHDDPLFSAKTLQRHRILLDAAIKADPASGIFKKVDKGHRPTDFESLINVPAGKNLTEQIFKDVRQDDNVSSGFGSVMDNWAALDYTSTGKEMQCFWKAIVTCKFYGNARDNPHIKERKAHAEFPPRSHAESRAEGTITLHSYSRA